MIALHTSTLKSMCILCVVFLGQVNDDNFVDDPFKNFKVGQKLSARIIAKADSSNKQKNNQWELSIKPSLLSGKIKYIFDIAM